MTQSNACNTSSPQLQTQVFKLQQQLDKVSQQLLASNQRVNDGDAISDALRQDVVRLQQQLRHRDIDSATASERDAAAATAILAAENVAAQLRCDALVAQAREDALKQKVDAASQRAKAHEQDVKLLSDEKKSLQHELQDKKAACEEQNRFCKVTLRKHQDQFSKLVEELDAERLRTSKHDAAMLSMAASSTADTESLKQQLCAAKSSVMLNHCTLAQLQAAALAHDRQLQAAADMQTAAQKQVICLKIPIHGSDITIHAG